MDIPASDVGWLYLREDDFVESEDGQSYANMTVVGSPSYPAPRVRDMYTGEEFELAKGDRQCIGNWQYRGNRVSGPLYLKKDSAEELRENYRRLKAANT